jgi:hypothetical protein
MVDILTGVRWNLNLVLIAFPLWAGMLNISSCVFLATQTSSLEKVLFSSFAYFFIEIFRKFSFLSSLDIMAINPLLDV